MQMLKNGKYAVKVSANNYREVLIESAAMINGEIVYNGNTQLDIKDVYTICDDSIIGTRANDCRLENVSRYTITGWAMTSDGTIRADWQLYNAIDVREMANREYMTMVDDKQYVVKGDCIYHNKTYAEESCGTTITRLDGSVTEQKGLLQLIQLTDEQQALVDEYKEICQKMAKANIKHLIDTGYNEEAFINISDVQVCTQEYWNDEIAINRYYVRDIFANNDTIQYCHDDYALVVSRK